MKHLLQLEAQRKGSTQCWCEDGGAQLLFRGDTFGLVRCRGCGSYRIDPPAVSNDEESREFYTEFYSDPKLASIPGKSATRRTSRFWKVVKQVPDLRQAGQSVVDVGCGEGTLPAELKEAGWSEVIGVDVSRSRIARARILYPHITFHVRPLEETGIAEHSFDLLIMDNVIEHFPNPLAALRTLRRFLRPDGRIVVVTPNLDSGHFRLLGRRWTPELAPHAHIFLFTKPSLRCLLQRAGFTVQAEGNFHMPFAPWGLWWKSLARGDVKTIVWRAAQEAGAVYGRIIHAGPMLYAVAGNSTP